MLGQKTRMLFKDRKTNIVPLIVSLNSILNIKKGGQNSFLLIIIEFVQSTQQSPIKTIWKRRQPKLDLGQQYYKVWSKVWHKRDASIAECWSQRVKFTWKTFEHNAFISGNPFTKARQVILAQSNLNYSKSESEAFWFCNSEKEK